MSTTSLLSSIDIEKMSLSAAIADPKNLCTLVQNLRVTDFTDTTCQEVFLLLREIYKETENIGLHIVCQKAQDKGVLEKMGGLKNLMGVLTVFSIPEEIESYIELIIEKSSRRETLSLYKMLAHEIETQDKPISSIHELNRDRIYKTESRSSATEFKTVNQILESGFDGGSYLDYIQKFQDSKRETSISGIETGFKDLDDKIGGLQNGNLILLAARPGMGKTTLALNIFEHVCIEKNIPALFIPLEMSSNDIIEKIISSRCRVDYKKLREATINPIDFQQIVSFMKEERQAYISNKAAYNISNLRTAAIRAKDAFGIKLLIVDYLQLIRGTEKTRGENKYQEISEISMCLKNLARELDIPVICLSQLSRKVEDRQEQTPILSDLRDSGSLEADADIVLFLYRYDHKDQHNRPGQAKLIVAKNRRGETGDVNLKHSLGMSNFQTSVYQ